MIVRHITPALTAALLLAPIPATAQEQDEEKAAHFGIYTYVKGMRGDQPVPEAELKGSKVEVEEDEIELIGPDGEEQFEIKYTIDEEGEGTLKFSMEIIESSAMPDSVGSKAKGLGKHEGDTITLIYDTAEGADYPADFTPDGPSQHLFVLKKSADAEEDDEEGDDEKEDDDEEDDEKEDAPR